MSTPNPALETAITNFAQQPGVTPAEISQLRATLASDPGLTASLEHAASSGALHGFAPAAPGATNPPVGQYDQASRTVTLPASGFTSSGSAASAELHGVLRVQAMVIDFGGKSFTDPAGAVHRTTPEMLTNLQDTINQSPALADEVKRAATTIDPLSPQHRILESFAFTTPGSGVGGSFSASTHAMNLVSDSLTKTPVAPNSMGFDINDLTFVIGHEVQHGFNAQGAAQARNAFVANTRSLAASPGPVHDYTTLVERHVQSGREDEAKAEIAGWNALRSGVQQRHNGTVTLSDIEQASRQRSRDFVLPVNGTLAPRSNVQLNADLTMSQSPANIAAMGHNYFDRPVQPQSGDTRQAMHLGPGGVSDYSNYYAGWAVATIGAEERAAVHQQGVQPQVQINMAHAGLSESMMERGGLNLPSRQSIPYLDSSSQPAVPHRFDHTADGPNQYQYVPVAPGDPSPQVQGRLDDPSHPDHAFFNQVRSHVAGLDKSLGRQPDQHTDNIASAMTVQARADGLHRIDLVALSTDGDRLWAVQTPPGRNDHLFDLRTSVSTADAMTPMEHSAAKWPDAMQQFQQTQQQQAVSRQATHDQTQSQGPVMAHSAPMH